MIKLLSMSRCSAAGSAHGSGHCVRSAWFSNSKTPKSLVNTDFFGSINAPENPDFRALTTCLTTYKKIEYFSSFGVWLSLVERLLREQEVASSNLVTPTIFSAICTKKSVHFAIFGLIFYLFFTNRRCSNFAYFLPQRKFPDQVSD